MKEIRRYIRAVLLKEGLAGHGNKLLLLRIIDEIEIGNYEFLGDVSRGTQWKNAIAFRLTRPGLHNIWTNASPELTAFLEKKFSSKDFFIRNLTRVKWVVVDSYPNPKTLGQASISIGDDEGWRNKETGEEVYRSDNKFDDVADERYNRISRAGKTWRKENKWVRVYRRSAGPLDRYSQNRYQTGYISLKEENRQKFNLLRTDGGDPSVLAGWFRDKLSSDRHMTWEHEFQHWVQYLNYFTSRDDRTSSGDSYTHGRNLHPGTRGPVSNLVLNLFNAMFDVQVKVNEARNEGGKTIVPIVPGTFTAAESSKWDLKNRSSWILWWMRKIIDREIAKASPDASKLDLVWSAVAEHVDAKTREEFFSDQKYISELREISHRGNISYQFGFEFYDEKGKVIKSSKKWQEKAVAMGFWRITSSGRQRNARMKQSDYRSKFDNRSGLNTKWEDSIMEWDAELAANAARLAREVTKPSKSPLQARSLLVKLFISDTEGAETHVNSMMRLYMARFNDRGKIVREQADSFNMTVRKITDYLQECADRVDSESYITPEQWSTIASSDSIDQYNALKSAGWIAAFENEINQTNYQ